MSGGPFWVESPHLALPPLAKIRSAAPALMSKTTSPFFTFVSFLLVLPIVALLICNRGRYSLRHRRQNCSASYPSCLQLLRGSHSVSDGANRTHRRRRKWFGVRGSSSGASPATGVRGRLFTIASTSQRSVCRVSSLKVCCVSKLFSIFRMVRICRSHTPPKWEAWGGLNRHSIPRCNAVSLTLPSCLFRFASF